MATYTFTTNITQVDNSTINLAIPSVTPSVTIISPVASSFTNQRTAVIKNMATLIPTTPLPNDYDLDSTVAGMGSVFGDSVYKFGAVFTANGGADTYTTETYFLVTNAIDAGILALPTTTDADLARKAYIESIRQDIQDEFDAADYATANTLIGVALSYLNELTNAATGGTLTLSATDEFEVDISVLAFSYGYWGGWYNVITNTLTNVEYPYTFDFDPNTGGINAVTNPTDYPDGVYTNYSSVLGYISDSESNLFYLDGVYALVTTTVDAQVTLYGANYDPTNEAEAAAYAEMQALQTAIDVAFAANDYTEANSLIAQLQALLAEGVSIDLSAALSSVSDMVVSFTALPTGTYTNPTGTIENTLTGVDFTFNGFPTSNIDLSTILNSDTLGFGTEFPDGVYQLTVNFYVDGLLFTSMCYLPVTSAWQCCIDKAATKKCGSLSASLMQSNLKKAVRSANVYSNIVRANGLIKEGNRECSGCGCGCS